MAGGGRVVPPGMRFSIPGIAEGAKSPDQRFRLWGPAGKQDFDRLDGVLPGKPPQYPGGTATFPLSRIYKEGFRFGRTGFGAGFDLFGSRPIRGFLFPRSLGTPGSL